MKLPISFLNFKKILIIFSLLATGTYLFRLGGNYNDTIQHLIYLLTFPIGLFAVWSTMRILGTGNDQYRAFLTIFSGFCLAGIGQFIFDIGHLVFKSEIITLIATIFFLSSYLLTFCGYVLESRALKLNWKDSPGILAGFVILGLTLGVLIYKFEAIPLAGMSISPLERIISLGYVLGDVSLIIVSILIVKIALIYKGGLMSQPWLGIFIAHFMILIGDILFAIFSKPLSEDLWPYTLISLIWLVANLFIAAGFYGIGDVIVQAQERIRELRPEK